MRIARRARAVAGSLVGTIVAATALIGFAHTRPGRPLLAVLMPMMRTLAGSTCPFGYDVKPTPEQRRVAEASFARGHRGASEAPSRPALGFTLGATTPRDVMVWAASFDVRCASGSGKVDIECRDVPEALLPGSQRGAPLSTLWLTFGAAGTLSAVSAVRTSPRADVISAAFRATNEAVAQGAGPASSVVGAGSTGELSLGVLRQSSAEYRYQNYYAVTRAANAGHRFVLTEEYRALAD